MYRVKIQLILALLVGANSLMAQTGVITTIAGNTTTGVTEWGVQATATAIPYPRAIAVDYEGNAYIISNKPYVNKVDIAGNISRFAGTDTSGYAGDAGPATDARMGSMRDVAIDVWGNVYVADFNNNVIRKVNSANVISSFAGNGTWVYNGDGLPAVSSAIRPSGGICAGSNGSLYIVDAGNMRVRVVDGLGIMQTVCGNGTYGYSGDGGPATAATMKNPYGVAVSTSGEVYLSDPMRNTIRRIDVAGTITTIAGDSVAGYDGDGGQASAAHLSQPYGLALDGAGNLFIADRANSVIRKISTDGIISTVEVTHMAGYSGDGGPATDAQINGPMDVAVDKDGNLFIADYANNVIRKVNGVATAVRNTNKKSLQVFPVPCMGVLHAQLPARTDWNAELLDLTGQVVAVQKGNAQDMEWILPNSLLNGVYCLRISTPEGAFVNTIMLQR